MYNYISFISMHMRHHDVIRECSRSSSTLQFPGHQNKLTSADSSMGGSKFKHFLISFLFHIREFLLVNNKSVCICLVICCKQGCGTLRRKF